jgi:myo-inositol-1(or 4)-monophosphatase
MKMMIPKRRTARRNALLSTQAGTTSARLKRCLLECVKAGGEVVHGYFGKLIHPRQKESPSSIVCDADLASEKRILGHIQSRFPEHNIIAEESGRLWRGSEYTWVVDPLDGTSNFVAGLPWFGVLIAVLRGAEPIMAAMYLPVEDALYFAEAGKGAFRNGKRTRVTDEPDLQNVLCGFGADPARNRRDRRSAELLFRVAGAVRNTRATNSAVDFCYTLDGRFGAFVNLKTMIWDIAPIALMLPEAGGKFTGLDGKPIVLTLDEQATQRQYAVLGTSGRLHGRLAALTSGFRA